VKLLRLLQENEYFALGSDIPRYTDARVILATNKDLNALMESERFRKDLYHRIYVHRVQVPPLRERFDDIPLLVEHFLNEASKTLKIKKPAVPEELFLLLKSYNFPGNIRELRAVVLDAVSTKKSDVLSLKPFREVIGSQSGVSLETSGLERFRSESCSLVTFSHSLPTLKQVEELLIEEAMKRSGGNQTIAARVLGISRQALNNRLHRGK
jgi:DNA-binding NtrC family response regulator